MDRLMPAWGVGLLALASAASAAPLGSMPPLPPTPARNMSDPYYTAFHFQPLKNWMNDPNGPFYDEATGLYHLFAQYNPHGAKWGDMNWYHAVSKDMLHWAHLPIALTPDHSYDCGGEFSGSATVVPPKTAGGSTTPVLSVSVACGKWVFLAIPSLPRAQDPLMINWTKSGDMPFSGAPFDGPVFDDPKYSTGGFRDPTTAWQGKDGVWRMATGCGDHKKGGACLFKSANFANWTSVGWLSQPQGEHNTNFWECPDFFPVPGSDKFVLKGSAGGDWWSLGTYTEVAGMVPDTFEAVSYEVHGGNPQGLGKQQYDFGKFYASKSFYDPSKKRQVLYGWVAEEGSSPHAGEDWSSIQSIPRTITIDPLNATRLVFNPIEELASLRGAKTSLTSTLAAGASQTIKGAEGNQLDIVATFAGDFSTPGLEFGVSVLEPTSGGPAPQQIPAYMPGTDMPGDDLGCIHHPPKTDPHTCQATCEKDPKCDAWTYVIRGSPAGSGDCCLKSGVPKPSPSPTCTSGCVKGCAASPASGFKATVVTGLGFEGQDAPLGQVKISSGGSGPFLLSATATSITLRVLVDRSVIEAFAHGGRGVVTHRVYPAAGDLGVSLVRLDSIANVTVSATVDVYAMATADPPSMQSLLL